MKGTIKVSNKKRLRRRGLPKKVRVRRDGEIAFLTDKHGRDVGTIRTADLTADDSGNPAVNAARVRPPGLDGSHRGTCIACLEPTDTAVVLEGCVNYMHGVLSVWGIPMETIEPTLQAGLRDMPKNARVTALKDGLGRIIGLQQAFRVCTDCAGRAHMAPRLYLSDGELPLYRESDVPGSDECDHGYGEPS